MKAHYALRVSFWGSSVDPEGKRDFVYDLPAGPKGRQVGAWAEAIAFLKGCRDVARIQPIKVDSEGGITECDWPCAGPFPWK